MVAKRTLSAAFATLATVLFVLPSTALSQVEEIVVTAQKREQNLQEVPIAITAIQGTELQAAGIQDMTDLQFSVPSMSIQTAASGSTSAVIRIRGVGTSGTNVGLEGAVGVFIDGVYRSRSGIALNDLIDIERIEVLRGPQGTLFGKNTSAGALVFVTKKPTNELEGMVDFEYGNYDLRRTRAILNIPVIEDTLALRFSGGYNFREGFVSDISNGRHYNNRDRFTVRGQALWTPTPDVEVRLMADFSSSDENCCAPVRLITDGVSSLLGALGNIDLGQEFVDPPRPDDFVTSVNGPLAMDFQDFGFSGEVTWDLDFAELVAVTAYREHKQIANQDVDFIGADVVNRTEVFDTNFFSQEIRLGGYEEEVGPFAGLNWMFGFFYSREEISRTHDIVAGIHANVIGQALASMDGLYPAGSQSIEEYFTEGITWSFFHHSTLDITDRLSLTGGIRYNSEKKDGFGNVEVTHNARDLPLSGFLPVLPPVYDYVGRIREKEFTGTVKVQYQWTDDLMTYTGYSRGYKAGGINLDRAAGGLIHWNQPESCPGNNPVVAQAADGSDIRRCDPRDPNFGGEFVHNFEVGFRTQWWDNRIRFNVTGFWALYDDFQLNTFDGFNFTIENVEGVESKGVELEWDMEPIDNLRISGGLTWVDARYDRGVGIPGPGDPPLDAKQVTNAPHWTGTTAVSYAYEVVNDWYLFARGEVFVNSAQDTGSDLDPNKRIGGFHRVNGRLGIRHESGIEISGFCRNCSDERNAIIVFDSVAQAGSYDQYVQNPREYGLTLRVPFRY